MILAFDFGSFALLAMVVVISDFFVTFAIGRQLKKINDVLASRNALVVPDELGPEDRIVIWHKDDEPPPDDEPPKRDNGPIVGLG